MFYLKDIKFVEQYIYINANLIAALKSDKTRCLLTVIFALQFSFLNFNY